MSIFNLADSIGDINRFRYIVATLFEEAEMDYLGVMNHTTTVVE